jgi:8-oxo-dGTP diphosphatase
VNGRQSALIDVRVLLLRGSDVLLLQRSDALFPGHWTLPGGHVGDDEDAVHAALRELEEEAAVTVLPDHLRFAGVCHYRLTARGPKVGFAFTAHRWSGIPHVNESEKFSAASWHPLRNPPGLLVPHATEVLHMHGAGVHFSVYGWSENKEDASRPLWARERCALNRGVRKLS